MFYELTPAAEYVSPSRATYTADGCTKPVPPISVWRFRGEGAPYQVGAFNGFDTCLHHCVMDDFGDLQRVQVAHPLQRLVTLQAEQLATLRHTAARALVSTDEWRDAYFALREAMAKAAAGSVA